MIMTYNKNRTYTFKGRALTESCFLTFEKLRFMCICIASTAPCDSTPAMAANWKRGREKWLMLRRRRMAETRSAFANEGGPFEQRKAKGAKNANGLL